MRPDWTQVRAQFPLLARAVRGGQPLVYLDSAATSQKPLAVLEAIDEFYQLRNAAVHRGAYQLAEEATAAYERARLAIARFIAAEAAEIVWTSGATSSINTLAYAFSNATQGRGGAKAARFALRAGDEIVVTEAEHHSNLVPWQELCARTGAELRWFSLTDDGRLDIANMADVITERTRIVAFAHASNVTGAIAPVPEIVAAARAVGAYTVLDACQTVPHLSLDVHQLGIDFAVFSSHKMLGPTGVGVLYGRHELLDALPPVQTGGSMVEHVEMTSATFVPPPHKFEAGTQMLAQAVGVGVAARFLSDLGFDNIVSRERELATELLKIAQLPGVRVIGPADLADRLAVVSFVVDGVHAHDVGQVLDDAGIAVRVGQHCAAPLHHRFGIGASARASASVYTTVEEIVRFREALAGVRGFFGLD